MVTPLTLIFVISGFLFLTVPLGVVLRNYRQIKSNDYLILVGFFFSIALHSFSYAFWIEIFDYNIALFGIITYFLIHFSLFLHAIRLYWEKISVSVQIISLFFFLTILVESLLAAEYIRQGYIILISGHAFRSFVGIVVLYVYVFLTPVSRTKRIVIVRNSFMFAAGINLIGAVLALLSNLSFYLTQDINVFQQFWSFTDPIVTVAQVIPAIIITVIALRFPECLLITKVQLLRAKEIYKQIKIEPPISIEKNVLFSYLNSIPQEIFKEMS